MSEVMNVGVMNVGQSKFACKSERNTFCQTLTLLFSGGYNGLLIQTRNFSVIGNKSVYDGCWTHFDNVKPN